MSKKLAGVPGRYKLRAHVPGGFVDFDESREVTVEEGSSLANLDFHLSPFKKGRWQNFSHVQGLAEDLVDAIFQAPDGALWFGTGGVSRFDGRDFFTLTREDGLPPGRVTAIAGENRRCAQLFRQGSLEGSSSQVLQSPYRSY